MRAFKRIGPARAVRMVPHSEFSCGCFCIGNRKPVVFFGWHRKARISHGEESEEALAQKRFHVLVICIQTSWDLQTRGLLGHTGEFTLTSLRRLCLHDDPCLPAGQRHASDGPYE